MFFRKVVESLDLQKLYYICKTNTFRHLKTFKVQKMIRKHDQNIKIYIYIYINVRTEHKNHMRIEKVS